MKLGVKGFYKFVKSTDKDCKDITYESGWMPNLITNAGLDYLAGQYLSDYSTWEISVGADNTTPSNSDTSLGSFIAAVHDGMRGDRDVVNTTEEDYGRYRFTLQFGEGEAEGNIAEVGFKRESQTDLFSRALVVDSNGDPTTITVLDNEYLTVTYEIRVEIPSQDFTATIDIDEDGTNVNRDVVIRANGGSSTAYWAHNEDDIDHPSNLDASGDDLSDYLTGQDSGEFGEIQPQSYTNGSYNRDFILFWDVDQANISIKSVFFKETICASSWKMSFDPPIDKDNTKELSLTFNIAWDRA